jgi:hypothetical protein
MERITGAKMKRLSTSHLAEKADSKRALEEDYLGDDGRRMSNGYRIVKTDPAIKSISNWVSFAFKSSVLGSLRTS